MSGMESEFTVRISLKPSEINSRFESHLEDKLKTRYGDICTPKMGYIPKSTIKMTKRSVGQVLGSNFNGDVTFTVTFVCNTYFPKKSTAIDAENESDIYTCQVTQEDEMCIFCRVFDKPYTFMIPKSDDYNPDKSGIETGESNYMKQLKNIKADDIIRVRVVDSKLIAGTRTKKPSYWIIGTLHSVAGVMNKVALNVPNLAEDESYEVTYGAVSLFNPDFGGDIDTYHKLTELKNTISTLNKDRWNEAKIAAEPYGHVKEVNSKSTARVANITFFKISELLDEITLPDGDINVLCIGDTHGGITQAVIHMRNYKDNAELTDNYFIIFNSSNQTNFLKNTNTNKGILKLTNDIEFSSPDTESEDGSEDTDTDTDTDTDETDSDEGKGPVLFSIPNSRSDLTNLDNIEAIDGVDDDIEEFDLIVGDHKAADANGEDQEINHYKTIITEAISALKYQKEGGTFILKIYDMYTRFTTELIHLIGQFYNNVFIYKPHCGSLISSEKYIVFTDFTDAETKAVITILENIVKDDRDMNTLSSLDINLDDDTVRTIMDYNNKYKNKSLDTLREAMGYYTNPLSVPRKLQSDSESRAIKYINDRLVKRDDEER